MAHSDLSPCPITVLCVDDSHDIVMLLEQLINKQADMTAVQSVHSATELIDAAVALQPSIAVVDLTMPGNVTSIEAIRQVSEKVPETRVIAYSGYDDSATREQVIDAGAWGLVSKNADIIEIIHAIRKVAGGEFIS